VSDARDGTPPDGSGDGPGADGEEAVGSVGEEAAKLFGALSDWARDQGSDLGTGLSGIAAHAASAAREVDDHLATGAAECTYCPICRTVHLVRQTSPEVRAQLAVAASSLMQAAAGLLATAVPTDERRRGEPVEHIDLDLDEDGGDGTGAVPDDWPEEER
jgi:hypothetical protein